MPNYKPYADQFTVAGFSKKVQWIDCQILYFDINGSTSALSLKNTATNASYTVPTGRFLEVIGIIMNTKGASSTVIYQGDTEHATTLGKVIYIPPSTAGHYEFFGKISFAAGKFVTVQETGANLNTIFLVGYLV